MKVTATSNSSKGKEIFIDFQPNSTEVILKLFACVLVGILSIAGNTLVAVVVLKVPRMKTATFYLLLNMSISDLLFTCIALPPFMLSILGHGLLFGGVAGIFICKFMNSSSFGLMASSVLSMTAIAFDRYFAVKTPTRKIIHGKILKGVIALIWMITVLVMAPLLWSYNLAGDENFYYCYEEWPILMGDPLLVTKIYTVVLFCTIYMIPFAVMGVLYFIVGHDLWFRKIVGIVNVQSQRHSRKKRQKVVSMLIIVLVVFVICWLPMQVISFIFFFSDVDVPSYVVFIGEILLRANGALNPLCYVCFSETFRQAVLQIEPFKYCFERQDDDLIAEHMSTPVHGEAVRSSILYKLFRRKNIGQDGQSEMISL